MPVNDQNHKGADELAGTLFTALIAGTDFTVPDVDLSGDEFQIPAELDNPLFTDVQTLTADDLTTKTVDGSGMFDCLMQALNAHLSQEYSKGRISGAQYAETYIQLTSSAMGQAVQYLLGKDNAYWQAQLVQQQARAAQIAAVRERVNLEIAKLQLITAKADAETSKVNYALTKMKLATEDMQYTMLTVQQANLEYQTNFVLPAQKAHTDKQTEHLDYELVNIMPKEASRVQKQIDVMSGEISLNTARTDQILYQTANILPAQKSEVDSDIAIKAYQLSNLLPAQVAGLTKDNLAKDFNNNSLLPEQLVNLQEQTEAHRAKTLDTRRDGVTVITGAIGKQKDLHSQQIDSYKRDAEQKIGKMYVDTWITQKSIDEGLVPPAAINDTNLNSLLTKIRAKADLV